LKIADLGLKNDRLGSVAKGIDTDVLILGTSRAYRHFDIDKLEQLEGKKFFNLGLDASGFKTQKALLEYYLKYNEFPKEIIWEYNFGFLNKEEVIYDYELLFPIADESTIYSILREYELIPNFMGILKESRYLGNTRLIRKGLSNYFKPIPYLDYKIQNQSWDSSDFENKYLNGTFRYKSDVSILSLNSFLSIIEKVKSNETKVTMVFTPMYSGIFQIEDEKKEILKFYDSIFEAHSIDKLDFLASGISSDTLNFYNVLHMNRRGVDLFTDEFAEIY
jgi:hypothetical protein